MKKKLLLPLVALSIISCSSDELQQQETPLRQKGTKEIVFDEIVPRISRAADISIDGLLPTDVYMGVIYHIDDKTGDVWYNNQKYEIITNDNGTQKFKHIDTGQGPVLYPIDPSVGINAIAYIPYIHPEDRGSSLFFLHGETDPEYTGYHDLTSWVIAFGDQLTKEQYRNHDFMYAKLDHMKETDSQHHLDFIHLNYRMQLTVDLSEVGSRNLRYFEGATLSLISKVHHTFLEYSVFKGETRLTSEDPVLSNIKKLGDILEFGTPTDVNEKFVTTFCIPPHLLEAGTPLFRLTFKSGSTLDISINPTKDKLLEPNKWAKYTLKLRPSEIVLGAKMNNWKASVIVTGSSEDDPADVFME